MSVLVILAVVVLGFVSVLPQGDDRNSLKDSGDSKVQSTLEDPTEEPTSKDKNFRIETIEENLDTPWGIVFLPNKSMLVTERQGRVHLIENGNVTLVATIDKAREISEGGLLGIALHPNFSSNNFVYLYYTFEERGGNTFNRVVRMTYSNKTLIDETIIVDKIPGARNHNGGRIKFGQDGFLYITTGDAENPSQSQDINSLAGKILRVTDTGQTAPENPFNSLVYSYGHRNAQGLAWDTNGNLWATEHGRSGALSGLDELNLITAGKNYGWDIIQGDEKKEGMETPRLNSGDDTWAPAGAAFVGNSLFFAGLRGQALYESITNGNQVTLKEHLKGEFGRIRDVVLGPDNMLYITTSNQDGRGNPIADDDRIIKVNPQGL